MNDETESTSERLEPEDESAGVHGGRRRPTDDPEGEDRDAIERGVASQAAAIASGAAVIPSLVPDTPDDEHPTPI